ncbi:hypothetical protein QUF80_10640 [Desulfococcaceae bacterium HSG8]|nr:hypothetical protein [Desulfococcaceae bacterium HSG8]
MNCKLDIVCETGLQFFGKMSSSNFHEIKNALAIINENAGLLEDFSNMTSEGRIIDSERLMVLARKIMKQVRRTDEIVRNINRFSHSVDDFVKRVDVGETVGFVATISERFAVMRGVVLEPKHPETQVRIITSPFFLENLIWLCLDFAMNAAGDGKTVGLITEETESGARVRFTRLDALGESSENMFPTEREEALIKVLGAYLTVNTEAGEIILGLAKTI